MNRELSVKRSLAGHLCILAPFALLIALSDFSAGPCNPGPGFFLLLLYIPCIIVLMIYDIIKACLLTQAKALLPLLLDLAFGALALYWFLKL
jgi:hypothetical protein